MTKKKKSGLWDSNPLSNALEAFRLKIKLHKYTNRSQVSRKSSIAKPKDRRSNLVM